MMMTFAVESAHQLMEGRFMMDGVHRHLAEP